MATLCPAPTTVSFALIAVATFSSEGRKSSIGATFVIGVSSVSTPMSLACPTPMGSDSSPTKAAWAERSLARVKEAAVAPVIVERKAKPIVVASPACRQ